MKKYLLVSYTYVDGFGFQKWGQLQDEFRIQLNPPGDGDLTSYEYTLSDRLLAAIMAKTPAGAVVLNIIDLSTIHKYSKS